MEEERRTQLMVMIAVVTILGLLLMGTIVYAFLEGWDLVDSLYFTAITLTTIGYGDLFPTNPTSKIFTVFFAFAGVGTLLFSLSIVAEYNFKKRLHDVEDHMLVFLDDQLKSRKAVKRRLKKLHKRIAPKKRKYHY